MKNQVTQQAFQCRPDNPKQFIKPDGISTTCVYRKDLKSSRKGLKCAGAYKFKLQ